MSDLAGHVCAACQGSAKLACSGCLLVVYCGSDCQVAHRSKHKRWCKSPLIKSTWKPNWMLKGRIPAFMRNSGPFTQDTHGTCKYLWGNIPALDVIQLRDNEGLAYDQDLDILFAASGDLRNVVKSVGSVPDEYTRRLGLYINDMDFGVVARNLIITLVGLVTEDGPQAITCMLHVWYSSFVRESDASLLTSKILPLIEDVNRKIEGKAAGTFLGKTWKFGKNTCRAELTKENWNELLSYVQGIPGLSPEKACRIRSSVTLAPHREDYRDRWLLSQQPAHRVGASRFFEEGILLSFGTPRDDYNVPNPTLFRTTDWPMMDSANPLQGWSSPEVLNTYAGPATGDLYGKLFHHISKHLEKFHTRLTNHGSDFFFLNVNARLLRDQATIKYKAFARIEVSNISDAGYLGIGPTLGYLGVMLQATKVNPHATLITLFLSAVPEMLREQEQSAKGYRATAQEIKQAMKFMNPGHPGGLIISQVTEAVCHLHDFDAHFDRYTELMEFKEFEVRSLAALEGGLLVKKKHTVVEKWPLRLKLKHGQDGAQSEFDVLHASGHIGHERYVEWKRGG